MKFSVSTKYLATCLGSTHLHRRGRNGELNAYHFTTAMTRSTTVPQKPCANCGSSAIPRTEGGSNFFCVNKECELSPDRDFETKEECDIFQKQLQKDEVRAYQKGKWGYPVMAAVLIVLFLTTLWVIQLDDTANPIVHLIYTVPTGLAICYFSYSVFFEYFFPLQYQERNKKKAEKKEEKREKRRLKFQNNLREELFNVKAKTHKGPDQG